MINQKARAFPVVGFFMKNAVYWGRTRLHKAIKVLETARIMKKSIKFSITFLFVFTFLPAWQRVMFLLTVMSVKHN